MWNTYYSVFKLQPNTNTNTIRVWKIMRIWIRIYLVSKNHPSKNSIQFENICRIRIQISLFGLNYSNTILFLNQVFRYFTPLKQSWILWEGSLRVNVIEKLKFSFQGEIHTIRFSNFNRIRIRILFGFGKSCEYEYE